MNNLERIELIQKRLQEAFSPSQLDIIDDRAEHHGHANASSGAGYYTVVIAANYFKNISRVEAHRAIYQILNDLIPHEIHALRIKVI